MKKLIFIAFFIPNLTFAQQKQTENKLNLGISITPELNLLLVDPNLNQGSKSRLGLSSSFIVQYQLSKNLFLRTGLGIGIKRYDYLMEVMFPSDIDPMGQSTTSNIETKFGFNEIQIPILFQMDVANHKYFIGVGTEFNHFNKSVSKRTIYYGNGDIEELSIKTNKAFTNASLLLSLGYNIKGRNKMLLSLEPMLKLYFKEYIIEHSQLCNFGLKTTFIFGSNYSFDFPSQRSFLNIVFQAEVSPAMA